MEGVQLGPGDQCGLVPHPELVDGVEGVGEDDALVSKSGLEYGAILLGPFLSNERVVVAEFEEGAEDGPAGYLGKAFDFGLFSLAEDFPEDVDDGENGYPKNGR